MQSEQQPKTVIGNVGNTAVTFGLATTAICCVVTYLYTGSLKTTAAVGIAGLWVSVSSTLGAAIGLQKDSNNDEFDKYFKKRAEEVLGHPLNPLPNDRQYTVDQHVAAMRGDPNPYAKPAGAHPQ